MWHRVARATFAALAMATTRATTTSTLVILAWWLAWSGIQFRIMLLWRLEVWVLMTFLIMVALLRIRRCCVDTKWTNGQEELQMWVTYKCVWRTRWIPSTIEVQVEVEVMRWSLWFMNFWCQEGKFLMPRGQVVFPAPRGWTRYRISAPRGCNTV